MKELNESLVWLGVIREGGLLDTSLLRPAEEECTVKKRCGFEKQSPGG